MTRKIDFYTLPRPVQDRFVAATRRAVQPAPLLFARASRVEAWTYLVGGGALIAVLAIILRIGEGDVHSALALHGPFLLALDSLLVAGASYGVLHGAGILSRLRAFPYRPGTYLFPGCVVDAQGTLLCVWPMDDVESVERVGLPAPGLALVLRDGTRVIVAAPSAAAAERAGAALEPLRRELARAKADGDPRPQMEFDPLHDRALSSPIGPSAPMTRSVPAWIRFDWAIALTLGIVLGHGVGTARNAMSDAAMYRDVMTAGSVEAFTAYLIQQGSRADEVRDVLLPLAELRDAERAGTVEAVQAFSRSSASSKIGPDVTAAMRRAMLAELGRAKGVGTLAALDDFARRYPDAATYVDAPMRAARHTFYAQALAGWKEKAQPNAATEAFFGRLLVDAEKMGPAAEVRFRRDPSTSIADADRSVQKSGRYPGVDALPSNYVTGDALQSEEQRVLDTLVQAFASAFSPAVLSLRAGDTLAADAPVPTSPPTLVIEYAPEWARANTACEKPSTVFAGLTFSFTSTFVLPDGPPLRVALKASRTAAVWKARPNNLSREEFEKKIYTAMIDGAFDQLEKKLNDVLL